MAEEKQTSASSEMEQTNNNATTAVTTENDQSGTPKTTEKEDKKTSDSKSGDDKPSRPARRRKSDRRGSKRSARPERERSEFEQRIIGIRRVTRVVAGGRRFSFSVAMVVGDRKGRVGVGLGKSTDTALAIDKAVRDAKKNMIKVNFNEDNSIDHELSAKFKASIVEIRPAPGRGLVAGSSVRDVLELAGAQNISAKLLSRSKNKINNARCAIQALSPISSRARVSLTEEKRGNDRRRNTRSRQSNDNK